MRVRVQRPRRQDEKVRRLPFLGFAQRCDIVLATDGVLARLHPLLVIERTAHTPKPADRAPQQLTQPEAVAVLRLLGCRDRRQPSKQASSSTTFRRLRSRHDELQVQRSTKHGSTVETSTPPNPPGCFGCRRGLPTSRIVTGPDRTTSVESWNDTTVISEQTAAVIAQTPDQWAIYKQACEALGARLAAYRKDAGLTRKQLASALGRSLSTIRRAETGASQFTAAFWRAADETFNTGGILATEWVRVAEHKFAAEAQYADKLSIHEAASRCLNPQDCLCRVAVAHWTQREIRALRMALRFGFPQWASVMQTDLETVYAWESPRGPLPNLEDQLQFDQLLARVDIDVRARFRKLLAPPPPAVLMEPSPTAGTGSDGNRR